MREYASAENLKPEIQRLKDMDLTFSSPRELFIPLKDLLFTEKENAKASANNCRMNFPSAMARDTMNVSPPESVETLRLPPSRNLSRIKNSGVILRERVW